MIHVIHKQAYHSEEGYLKNYLRHGIDPYDFTHFLPQYWDECDIPHTDEDIDDPMSWLENSTTDQQNQFKKWLEKQNLNTDWTTDPAYISLEFQQYNKPTWLVHFTNHPWEIAQQGFSFGHPDFHGLHLTTYKQNRQKYAGFNFAFEALSRDAKIASRQQKYGQHAVVFWNSSVKTYHYGDSEHQCIFWGPSVNKNWIFPIESHYDEWTVSNQASRTLFKGSYEDAVHYVIQNHDLIRRGWQTDSTMI